MALSTANVDTGSHTFQTWVDKTNTLLDAYSTTIVTTAANSSGGITTGNATVNGIFTSNSVSVNGNSTFGLRGGNVTTNATLFITSNVSIGNATVNTVIDTTVIDTDLMLTVLGNTSLTNGTVTFTTNSTSNVYTFGAGNTSFDSGVLFVDATNNRVGINNTAPGVALVVTGSANVSTSVNSAQFTVGTSFIANTTGTYHTGTINAASFTTTGLVANVTALVPTSNTILLGNSIGRFVLSANTGDFTGTVTGTVANMSTSVNSALLTVGTSFIANTTGTYHTGTINAASFTTTGLVANTTVIAPTSNTILLGNSIGRFVLSANTGDFTGAVSGISFSTSGLVANTTALVPTSNTILLGNSIGRFVLSANTGNFSGNVTISGTSHTIAGNVDIDSGTLVIDAAADTVKVKNLSTNTGSIYINSGVLSGVTLMSISNGDIGSNITSAQTIATFTKTLYPTGQLTITASNTTHKQVEHLIFAHNDTDIQTTVFGRVAAPASANLGIANVAISGADLVISFNQATASTKINILANLFTP